MSISQNFPTISPSLNLNFARSKKLDPRITFNRPSTATRVNSNGIIQSVAADVPRFNHSYNATTASTNSLGLLIEDTRTNLLTYSEQFNDASWSKFNVNVTTNTTVAPDGTTNAELMTRTTTNPAYFLKGYTKAASSIIYTASAFVKKSVGNYCALTTQGTYPSRAAVVFDINSGTISRAATAYSSFSNVSASIIPYPNGWYRISLTATSDTATTYDTYFTFNSNGGEIDFNDTASNSAGFIWGAQLEEGGFATSYIPTTNAQVTRQGDLAYIDLPSSSPWYNRNEGSIIFQHTTVPYGGVSPGYPGVGVAMTTGSSASTIQVFFDKSNSFTFYLVRDIFVDQAYEQIAPSPTGVLASKVGFAYTTNLFVAARNGVGVVTDTSGIVPQQIGTLILGTNDKNRTFSFNAHISNVTYYPKSLSSSQLQNLTK